MVLAEDHIEVSRTEDSFVRVVSGVSHDLNNALGAIVNLSLLLARRVDDASVRHDVETIHAAARQAIDVVGRLARIAGTDLDGREPIDLRPVVREALAGLDAPDQVTIRLGSGVDPVPAYADRDQLIEVVTEIARNAVEAMPAGGVLEVLIEAGEPPVHEAKVRITDRGIGMAANVRDRAAEPFFTTKTRAPGRGLGLTVADHMLRRNGGGLEINSAPGAGTTVVVTVPSSGPEERVHDG